MALRIFSKGFWGKRKKPLIAPAGEISNSLRGAEGIVVPKTAGLYSAAGGKAKRIGVSRRNFFKKAAVISSGAALGGAVAVNVVEREAIVSSRKKILKNLGVVDFGEWARVKTPFFEPLYRELGRGNGFKISFEQAKGMNVLSDLAEAVYYNNAPQTRPSAEKIGMVSALVREHWGKAVKYRDGVGDYVFLLKNSPEWEERRAGEALDLLLLNPSTKVSERKAVWHLLWGKKK